MQGLLATDLRALPAGWRSATALLHPERTGASAGEIIARGGDLFEVANKARVVPLIFERWGKELAANLSPQEHAHWRASCLAQIAISARRRAEATALLAEMSAADVRPIVLRGLWIGEAFYDKSFLRPHADADLIIPLDAIDAVREMMVARGFSTRRSEGHDLDAEEIRQRLARGYWAPVGDWERPLPGAGHMEIDLHATLPLVGGGWWRHRPSPEYVYERSEPWEFDGIPLRALRADFALLTQCAHVYRHAMEGWGLGSLVGYYDVALLGRALTAEAWERLAADAAELRLKIQLAAVLDKVTEMWGPLGPEGFLAKLGLGRLRRVAARFALRHRGWLPWHGPTAVLKLCAAETPRDRIEYLLSRFLQRT